MATEELIGAKPETAKKPPPKSIPLPKGAKATAELLEYIPQLSLAERNRRWDGIRKRMVLARMDALLFMANDIKWGRGATNLRYATQVGSTGHAVFFLDRDPIIWNGIPNLNRPTNIHLSTQKWVSDLRPYMGAGEVIDTLRESGLVKGRIGLVSFGSGTAVTPTYLHGDMLAYQRGLPNCDFVDANWIFEEMRMIKSEEEIAMLTKAGALARKTIDALIEYARPGITEAGLFAELVKTQIANGGEPQLFHLLASGPVEHPETELWHLLHGGGGQPVLPSMRPIRNGDLVITEFHTQYCGYLAAAEFTVYVGKKAPGRLLDIHKVCVECLHTSQEVLQPGNTVSEAVEAIRRPVERAGMDYLEVGFHGHGLASPEFPSVVFRPGYGMNSLNGHRIGELILEEGMVFGNNFDVFDPRWKPDVGCMFGDTMVVRKGGAQKLVNVPLDLPQTVTP